MSQGMCHSCQSNAKIQALGYRVLGGGARFPELTILLSPQICLPPCCLVGEERIMWAVDGVM